MDISISASEKFGSRTVKKETETDKLLKLRTELIQKEKKAEESMKQEISEELEKVEIKVSKIIAETNRNRVVENFNVLKNSKDSTNPSGVWKIIRKIYPKNNESLPFAKKDFGGKLISSQKELKCLYLNTFKCRLRHRPIKPGYERLKQWKEELCNKRVKMANITNLPHGRKRTLKMF